MKSDDNSEAVLHSHRICASSSLNANCHSSTHASNCSEVRYCCGKACNGLRGLKMHQRSCRVLKRLEQETFYSVDINETYDDTVQIEHQINVNSIPTIELIELER